MNPRWRVERAGSPTGGYGRGWFACTANLAGSGSTPGVYGRWFPTFAEAIAWATEQADLAAADQWRRDADSAARKIRRAVLV